jgi:hypothetical protein
LRVERLLLTRSLDVAQLLVRQHIPQHRRIKSENQEQAYFYQFGGGVRFFLDSRWESTRPRSGTPGPVGYGRREYGVGGSFNAGAQHVERVATGARDEMISW